MTDGIRTDPRGGLNLYGPSVPERAWGLTHKKRYSNGYIRPQSKAR
nr:MAG TPA: hypothetical protein [Caudoviricetes sp.]